MKTKTELREIAKNSLTRALSKAYYSVVDNQEDLGLSEDELNEVLKLMDNYGKAMCKSIRKDYYTV